jgi:hypothetical protein
MLYERGEAEDSVTQRIPEIGILNKFRATQ